MVVSVRASHLLHSEAPGVKVKRPFAHFRHAVSPSMLYWPGKQGPEQLLEFMWVVLPKKPPGQARQASKVSDPILSLQRPVGQASQAAPRAEL